MLLCSSCAPLLEAGEWPPDRIEHHWTLIGTNTAGRVRICGFKFWQIGADRLIASSQGHFDSSEYHRQLERGMQEPQ
jgi:hypothetical protein